MTDKIGRYRIDALIGKGGMGTVYRAFDPVLERTVAIKTMTVDLGSEDGDRKEAMDRCLAEARLSSQLLHQNIVITYDAGFERNMFYIALEYLDGKALRDKVQSRELDYLASSEIVFNVCHALQYIHDRGLVHQDIKPANIMITRMGEVKLMDFGIARLLKNSGEVKGFAGSAPYMSPEQTGAGYENDHRSDIFSLGVILYELLSGRKPFEGDSTFQIMYNIIHSPAPPLRDADPNLPEPLVQVVEKAMEKNPADRFKTAREFADALLPVIRGKSSKAFSAEDRRKIDALRRLVFFQYFQDRDMERVLDISSWQVHRKGAFILEGSQRDSGIYMLISGRASLIIKDVKETYGPGDFFGESAVLFQRSRQAKLRAETDCLVMNINANILNQEESGLQVMFLKEFYRKKTRQLVHSNLKLIQADAG
jgi:serine/threonine protein kinase